MINIKDFEKTFFERFGMTVLFIEKKCLGELFLYISVNSVTLYNMGGISAFLSTCFVFANELG